MKYIFILALSTLICSCSKTRPAIIGDNEYVTLTYKQTGCADVWGYGTTDSLTLIKVAGYLNANGLYNAGLFIKNDGVPEACLACVCKTGKAIIVNTLNSEALKAKYAAAGFK